MHAPEFKALFQPRPWGVETSTAQGEIVGRRHYGRKALPPGGGGGRNPTRELFDTLLLWRGTVVLGDRRALDRLSDRLLTELRLEARTQATMQAMRQVARESNRPGTGGAA